MKGILEEMSLPAAKVYLACLAVCKEQNAGCFTGVIAVSRDILVRSTKLHYYKVTDSLHELEQFGLLCQEGPGRYRVTVSNRPLLQVSEPPRIRVSGHRPTSVTRVTSSPLRSRESNTIYKHSDSVSTVQSEERQSVTLGASRGKIFTSVCPEVVSLVSSSLKRLGINPPTGSAYVKGARNLAAKRLREGHTPEELLKVINWAVSRWIQGDRFPALKQFNYLWGQNLPSHIAASRGGRGFERDSEEFIKKVQIVDPTEGVQSGRPPEGTGRVPTQDEQSY